MSGRITIDNLSESLKDYLNGLGITEEQVQKLIELWAEENIGKITELQTNSKVIIPAINEVKDSIDNKDLSAYQTVTDNDLLTTNKTIVEAINEVFQSGNSAKQELVAALVAKGLGATTDMNFSDLISYIENMLLADGSAVASDVLSGKTFINSTGELLTGTMTNQGSKTITASKSSQTLDAGYYNKITINGVNNLTSENIKEGVTIFGVTGSYNEYDTGEE